MKNYVYIKVSAHRKIMNEFLIFIYAHMVYVHIHVMFVKIFYKKINNKADSRGFWIFIGDIEDQNACKEQIN